MTNTLKINYTNHTIVMDRTFAKLAQDTRSEEYARLQAVRRDYPTFTVVQRTIRKNENKVLDSKRNKGQCRIVLVRISQIFE